MSLSGSSALFFNPGINPARKPIARVPNLIASQSFSGLGEFGSPATRPTPDYVMTGDVIRVQLALGSQPQNPTMTDQLSFDPNAQGVATLRNANWGAVNLNVVGFNNSNTGFFTASPSLMIDVQALGDFAHVADVTSIVSGMALNAGLTVDPNYTVGNFLSQVQNTGAVVPTTTPVLTNPIGNTVAQIPNQLASLIPATLTGAGGLLSSPLGIAAVLGGGLLLFAMLKK